MTQSQLSPTLNLSIRFDFFSKTKLVMFREKNRANFRQWQLKKTSSTFTCIIIIRIIIICSCSAVPPIQTICNKAKSVRAIPFHFILCGMLHCWTLRSIRIIFALVAVFGLFDIPATLGWASSQQQQYSRNRNRNSRSSLSSMSSSTDDGQTTFKVLGVCGGIGSGKSTACKLLVDSCHCLSHIDADKVAHSVYAPGSNCVTEIVEEFGSEILLLADDTTTTTDDEPMEIDRKKLGAIVFAERSAMAKLEAIVWPHVKDRLTETINELRSSWESESKSTSTSNGIVVLEAAILLDAGWDDLLDGLWVVTASRHTALARLVETRGLTQEEAAKRIQAQESRRGIGGAATLEEERNAGNVHCVISNDGSLEDLELSLQTSLDDPNCW
jgi:dephospho-CoA kinase